jgi:hypothetical protein
MKIHPHDTGRDAKSSDDGFYIFAGLIIFNVFFVILAVAADLTISLNG